MQNKKSSPAAKPVTVWSNQERYFGKRSPRAYTWALDPESPEPRSPAETTPQDLTAQFTAALSAAGVSKEARKAYLQSFQVLPPHAQRQALAIARKNAPAR